MLKVETTVSRRIIADAMTLAIEGGSGYWCEGIFLLAPSEDGLDIWYDDEAIYSNPDLRIQVVEYEAHKGNKRNWIFGLAEIERGLKVMSEGEGGHHWRDLLDEAGDAITADVFLQCVVFGEVVYG